MEMKIEVKPGVFVIAVPVLWKLKDIPEATPEQVCSHVAKQMFGDGSRLYVPSSLGEGAKVIAEAWARLEAECMRQGRSFRVRDSVEGVVRIGAAPGVAEGDKWLSAGLRWVRLVKVSDA